MALGRIGLTLVVPALGTACLAIFIYQVAGHGLPVLRQDWQTPTTRSEAVALFSAALSGWSSYGIGSPNLYGNAFALQAVSLLLSWVLGPPQVLALAAAATAALCFFGAVALVRELGCGKVPQAAAGIVAVFNPWVYTEVVAGHLYMVMAYGAMLALAAELIRRPLRTPAIALLTLIILQQLQFFLVTFVALAIFALVRRHWFPVVNAAVLGVAGLGGLLFNGSTLLSVPYAVAWEASQSLEPAKALLLQGYFAQYTASWPWPMQWAVGSIGITAAIGALIAWRERVWRLVLAATALLVVFTMGVHGPLPGWYVALAEHFSIGRSFRELYDLIGIAAIGYLLLASRAARSVSIFGYVLACAGVVLIAGWFVAPPSRWWVDARRLPSITVVAPPNTRYALLPPFQPLHFAGEGSGFDPDIFPRENDVTPLNQYLAAYPVNTAFARYLQSGDASMLEALSVSEVVVRPWLESDVFSLAQQAALPLSSGSGGRLLTRRSAHLSLAYLPELSVLPVPAVGSLDTNVGSGNVFFGDVAGMKGEGVPPAWRTFTHVLPVAFSDTFVQATRGWVDARLAFASEPSLGQPFGGALTEARGVPLRVVPGLDALVYVQGRLLGIRGKTISRSTAGYRWVRIPRGVTSVSCVGLCVIALQARVPPGLPLDPGPHRAQPVDFAVQMPWLLAATLPPGSRGMLRYNAAFDPHWITLLGGRALLHLRVDGSVNGWILPARDRAERVLIIDYAATVQALLELAGACWMLVLLLRAASGRHLRTRAWNSPPARRAK